MRCAILILFVQFKKHPWKTTMEECYFWKSCRLLACNFTKSNTPPCAGYKPATLLKLTLLHGCFSVLNCTNGTKSRKTSQLFGAFSNIYGGYFIKKQLMTKGNEIKLKIFPKSMFCHFMSITRGLSMLMFWHSTNWMKSKGILKSVFGHSMSIKTIKLTQRNYNF